MLFFRSSGLFAHTLLTPLRRKRLEKIYIMTLAGIQASLLRFEKAS
jgi:hypothetical protein